MSDPVSRLNAALEGRLPSLLVHLQELVDGQAHSDHGGVHGIESRLGRAV